LTGNECKAVMEHCCPLQNKAMDENPSPANGIAESKYEDLDYNHGDPLKQQ